MKCEQCSANDDILNCELCQKDLCFTCISKLTCSNDQDNEHVPNEVRYTK